MFELTVTGDISSAHFLRGYQGRCKDIHGHTWKIEVTILGEQLNEIGMVADFAVLKKQLKEFLFHLDHVCLNDLAFFQQQNPSTENIAKYIYDHFQAVVTPLKIKKVAVFESHTASVVYQP